MGLSKHADNDAAVFYTIEFFNEGLHYSGRITPEYKKGREEPSSWHVVLNDVFFGYLHKDGGHWEVSEQRPVELTKKVGEQIDKKSWEIHKI